MHIHRTYVSPFPIPVVRSALGVVGIAKVLFNLWTISQHLNATVCCIAWRQGLQHVCVHRSSQTEVDRHMLSAAAVK